MRAALLPAIEETSNPPPVRNADPAFPRAVHQLCQAGRAQLVQPGRTLSAWSSEILAMWRFTRNDGFHNKMELINREA